MIIIKFQIILLMFILLFASFTLGEVAHYNSSFGVPMCNSTLYTDPTPCVAGRPLINGSGTYELNPYNHLSVCNPTYGENNQYEGSLGSGAPNVIFFNEISAYKVGSGNLTAGDTVFLNWEGVCIEGDSLAVGIWYSLDNGTTWVEIDTYETDHLNGKVECREDFTFKSSDSGIGTRSFTIPLSFTGEYIALRYAVNSHFGSAYFGVYGYYTHTLNGCPNYFKDIDDLVLQITPYIGVVPEEEEETGTGTGITYNEGSIDTMFSAITDVETWAKILGGFAIVIFILFFGIIYYAYNGVEFGVFSFLTFTFIGILIATAVKLLPIFVILLFIVILLATILIKVFLGNNQSGGVE